MATRKKAAEAADVNENAEAVQAGAESVQDGAEQERSEEHTSELQSPA